MLRVKKLKKTYGYYTAVDDISFEVKSGEVFALLGHNGAGKTSILKCILDLRKRDGGVVDLQGSFAYLPEEKNLFPSYRIEKLVPFVGEMTKGFSIEKAISLIKEFEIDLREKISNLSHGQLSLVYLALVFSQEADIYILDEPTWGLDPLYLSKALKLVRNLSLSGKSILYASHIPSEIDIYADTLAIMRKGKILIKGSRSDISNAYGAVRVEKGTHQDGYFWKCSKDEDFYIVKRSEGSGNYEAVPFEVIYEAITRGEAI